jgi:hypothetical protein
MNSSRINEIQNMSDAPTFVLAFLVIFLSCIINFLENIFNS